jgi:hypothetical protein
VTSSDHDDIHGVDPFAVTPRIGDISVKYLRPQFGSTAGERLGCCDYTHHFVGNQHWSPRSAEHGWARHLDAVEDLLGDPPAPNVKVHPHPPRRGVPGELLPVVTDGTQYNLRTSRQLPPRYETDCGPQRIDVAGPMKHLHLSIEPHGGQVYGELDWTAELPAQEERHHFNRVSQLDYSRDVTIEIIERSTGTSLSADNLAIDATFVDDRRAPTAPPRREVLGLHELHATGVTQVVMSAWTTSVPLRSVTLTGTTTSAPSVMEPKSGGLIRAVARSDVVALAKYCTVIALGIQRWLVGTVASMSMPMAISAALHDAMACTVCRWLCTKNHLGTSTSAKPGSMRLT